jgi:hypothetical protein
MTDPSQGRAPRTPLQPGEPPGIAPGERIPLVVLGAGPVEGVVERIEELVQEGVRGLAWRIDLRLPDGTLAHGIKRGHSRLIFLDPRHRAG